MDPALRREETARLQSVPFARFEYVDVTVTTANADVDIAHSLEPTVPEDVRWLVVYATAAGVAYRDNSASKLAWTTDHVWLRFSATGVYRLLLLIEATPA